MNENYKKLLKKYNLRTVDKNSIWAFPADQFNYEYNEKNFGIKIHLSASILNYEDILKKFMHWNRHKKIGYKVINSVNNLLTLNEGRYGYSQTGKFITIYPENNSYKLIEILEELYKLFAGFRSPCIPSDQPFLDSEVVYVRYGEIHVNSDSFKDKRDGNFPDIAKKILPSIGIKKYYKIPDNIVIFQVIRKNAKGGVYKAIDLKNSKMVIIKEAMTNNILFRDGTSSVLNLFRESQILGSKIEIIPRLLDCFWVNENLFIEEEYIEGKTLESLILDHSIMKLNRTKIACQIVKAIEIFHNATNLVVNDISPANIMLKNGEITLIDFEFCTHRNSKQLPISGTIGFHDENYSSNDFSVDYYGIAMCFFYIFNPDKYVRDLSKNNSMVEDYIHKYAWFKKSLTHEYHSDTEWAKGFEEDLKNYDR